MADDFRSALIASADRLGLTPVEWGGIMSYESNLNPTRWGGAGGRHLGLIQFGPSEQKQFGVTGRETFAEQLPKAEAFLLSRGYKPGMGVMQAYSTINAGSPGRLNASDAKNGGMPGTVAEKVTNQFGPHFKKVAAMLGGNAVMTMPGETARSGRFGLSGAEASDAPAPAMALPVAEPDQRRTDILAMLAPLLQSGGAAMQAQPVPAQQPVAPIAPAPEPRPAQFDARRFYALLRR